MPVKFKSEVSLDALNNATIDTDKFLVSDSGIVKYRTGTQLLSDLGIAGIYVPYTGATGNVDLGTHTLSSYNLIVNHTSGSGVAASITKGGNGEALTINKTSGSGNAMSVTGGLTSLVDLSLSSIANATIDTDRFIVSDGGTIKYRTGAEVLSDIGGQAALNNPITGTGTTNYLSKFTGTTSLGNSQIFDNGTNVGIGTTSPGARIDVVGSFDALPARILRQATYGEILRIGRNGVSETASINYPADGVFAINTVSTERIRVDSDGNILVGQTSPIYSATNRANLTIGKSAGSIIVLGTSTASNGYLFYNNTDVELANSTSSGSVFFRTAGTERMRITSSGNVGIGTSSPDQKLSIQNSGTGVSGVWQTFKNSSGVTEWGISEYSSGDFNIYESGVADARLYIKAGGNVGIGTTSPARKLYVNGQIGLNDDLISENGANVLRLGYQSYYGSGGFNLTTEGSVPLTFGTSSNERMRITSAGNVGIGTSSPAQKLHVNGDANGILSLGRFENTNVGTAVQSRIQLVAGTATSSIQMFGSGHSTTPRLFRIGGSSDGGDMYLATGGVDRLAITLSGNVGIGTTSPIGKLNINGGTGDGSSYDAIQTFTRTSSTGNVEAAKIVLDDLDTNWGNLVFKVKTTPSSAESDSYYTDAVTIKGSNAYVGIGTNAPNTKLEVIGSAKISQSLTIGTGGNYEAGSIYSDVNWGMIFRAAQASPTNAQFMWADSLDNELMRIKDGKVGIGTSANYSATKLQVTGAGASGGIVSQDISGSGSFVRILGDASSQNLINWKTGTDLRFATSTDDFVTFAERMRIASNGAIKFNNYGSGTFTGTATQKLAVDSSGNIIEIPIGAGPVDGSGTTNYITKWTDADTIGNSELITDGSGNLAVAQGNAPTQALNIYRAGSTQTVMAAGNSNTGLNGTYFGVDANGNGIINTTGGFANIFSTNGSERMRITSGGNVGIGTTAPSAKLEVSAGQSFINQDYLLGWNVAGSSTLRAYIIGTSGNELQFWNRQGGTNTQAITLNASGNVGIGTSSPNSKLTIKQGVNTYQGGIRIEKSSDDTSLFLFNDGSKNIISSSYGSTGSYVPLYFQTSDLNRLIIDTNGNVGIGTTNPSSLLEVSGSAPVLTLNRASGSFTNTIDFKAGGNPVGSIISNSGTGEQRYSIGPAVSWGGFHTFYTDTSERMRITSDGNVGIGTSSPNSILHLYKTSYPVLTIGSGTVTGNTGIDTSGNFMSFGTETNHDVSFTTNNTPRMRITAGGNVGIGTSSPTGQFQVYTNAYKQFHINYPSIYETRLNFGTAAYAAYDAGSATLNLFATDSLYGSVAIGAGGTERMRIISNGNVGIGTSNPSEKFEVQNSASGAKIKVSNTGGGFASLECSSNATSVAQLSFTNQLSLIGGNVGIGTTNPDSTLTINGSGSSQIRLRSNEGNRGFLYVDGTEFALGTSTSIPLNIQTNGSTKMTVTSSGNVGIGTSSPNSQRLLDIAGNLRVQSGTIDFSNNFDNQIWVNASSMNFKVNASERLTITSGGNVGIGTTSPSNYSGYTTLSINNASSGGLIDLQNNGTSALRISADSSTQVSIYGATTVPMVFSTNATERMRVTAGGLVGIGTSNPSVRLDVNGNLSMGDGANGDQNIKIRYGNFSSGYGAIRFTESGTNNSTIHSFSSAWQGGDIYEHSTGAININGFNGVTFGAWNDVDIVFNTGGTNYFRSLVGIGTTNPTKLLDVNGDALISGLTIGLGGGFSGSNTALGNNALLSNTTGNYSTAVGLYALQNSETGVKNVAVGSLALTSNVSGGNCVAIGYGAGSSSNATGLTAIGANLALDTNLNTLGKDCLAISQFNSNATTAQVPHIYAPEPISVPNGTTPNIITFDNDHYAGAIVEYMIRLDDGGDYAMGTVYMGWKSSGSGNMKDIRQIVWNDMSDFVFDTNGGTTLSLANTSGSDAWVRITVRGIMNN